MSRLQHYFIPSVLLAPLILLCGKLLLTPVGGAVNEFQVRHIEDYTRSFQTLPTYEVGWPWVFQVTYEPIARRGTQQHSQILFFRWWLLLADLACMTIGIVGLEWFLLRHRRRRGRWLHVSLREMLAITALLAIICGWWVGNAKEFLREQLLGQHMAAKSINLQSASYCGPEWLRRMWPEAAYPVPRDDWTVIQEMMSPVWKKWIRELCTGPDLRRFDRFRELMIYTDNYDYSAGSEDALPDLPYICRADIRGMPLNASVWKKLRNVEELTLWGGSANDETLRAVSTLPKLKCLDIDSGPTSDCGIEFLSRCSSLTYLSLGSTQITDAAIPFISRLHDLRYLSLSGTRITDEGVAQLVGLTDLRIVNLESTQITDAAIESLRQISTLEGLFIWHSPKLTDRGMKKLLDFPNLRAVAIPGPPQVSDETVTRLKERFSYGTTLRIFYRDQ
jgi:hypothetical protein